jgi:hypothetical protein
MKVVGTPANESLIAAFSAVYNQGIIWDESANNPKNMIESVNPDLILIDKNSQTEELNKAAKRKGVPVLIIGECEIKFDHFKKMVLKPYANVVQINRGKRLENLYHEYIMLVYNFHKTSVNKILDGIRQCKSGKRFGIFGDRPIGQFYKGVPTLVEQSNLIASADYTICLSENDKMDAAANMGNGVMIDDLISGEYKLLSDEEKLEKKKEVFEDKTSLDRIKYIIGELYPSRNVIIDDIKKRILEK